MSRSIYRCILHVFLHCFHALYWYTYKVLNGTSILQQGRNHFGRARWLHVQTGQVACSASWVRPLVCSSGSYGHRLLHHGLHQPGIKLGFNWKPFFANVWNNCIHILIFADSIGDHSINTVTTYGVLVGNSHYTSADENLLGHTDRLYWGINFFYI